jgi:hypothetical protein
MSESTLYEVFLTKVNYIEEFKNGHGTGPVIWDYLAKTYLNLPDGLGFGGDDKPLWALARDPRVPLEQRIVHTMTFDHAIITPGTIREAALACIAVASLLPEDRVNHWGEIGTVLGDYVVRDNRLQGIGLNCTSVCDQWRGVVPRKIKNIIGVVEYAKQVRDA